MKPIFLQFSIPPKPSYTLIETGYIARLVLSLQESWVQDQDFVRLSKKINLFFHLNSCQVNYLVHAK